MNTKTSVIKLDSRRPDPYHLRQIAGLLVQGKIVAFPTETVYGLAACVNHPEAIQRIHSLKKRVDQKPFTYHIGNWGTLERLNVIQSRVFRYLSGLFWPGPVTLLALNRSDEKIGIRFPKNNIATQLINQAGELIVATSVNFTKEASACSADDVLKVFPDEIDVVIDGGKCELSEDSTIVDTIASPPQIVRAGVFADRVEKAIDKIRHGQYPRKKILIVCTGNTCRSPMAEGFIKSQLRKDGYGEQIEVVSCGIYARDGSSASMDSVLTLKNDEIHLDDFKSRMCRREDVLGADVILAMEEEHRKFIAELCPEVSGKIVVLHVDDPIGMTIDTYQKCYEVIKSKVLNLWREIVK
jgi:tRNA threonylcarbamoyl adenosine modification protein (Sua5/YciO/YrdC/YwlC family)